MVHGYGYFFNKGDLSIRCRLDLHGTSRTADLRAIDPTRRFRLFKVVELSGHMSWGIGQRLFVLAFVKCSPSLSSLPIKTPNRTAGFHDRSKRYTTKHKYRSHLFTRLTCLLIFNDLIGGYLDTAVLFPREGCSQQCNSKSQCFDCYESLNIRETLRSKSEPTLKIKTK